MMQWLNRLSVWGIYLASYVAFDWLGYNYMVQPMAISPWNPQSALSLFLLLRYGLKQWPALFVSTLLGEAMVRGGQVSPAYALLSATLSTLVYAAAAAALLRVGRMDLAFRSLRDLVWLTVVVAMGALVGAVAYVTVHMVAGTIPPDSWLDPIMSFWLGDFIGVMVLLPLLLLSFAERPKLAKFQPDL
jgi:integral membrane sensor domain MASE1